MYLKQLVEQLKVEFNSSSTDPEQRIDHALHQLIPHSLEVPYPGEGQTLKRWQILSQVAAIDLSLAKLYESHLDVLAILHELHADPEQIVGLTAIWAAEGGPKPLQLEDDLLSGIKPWCSAAGQVQQALLTYRDKEEHSQLLLVDMTQHGIQINTSAWHAVGMQYTRTAEVSFNQVKVKTISKPDYYLDRHGFWHGAAGVAACWFGATLKLAGYLKHAMHHKTNPFREMYLGEVSSKLYATRALFHETAKLIDADPRHNHELMIRALRAQVEDTALAVLELCGKALGAAPYCQEADFARCVADLPVFIRQSHAAFDLQCIGQLTMEDEQTWAL
ncbi:acyl-CoA dehydrogenase [Acinetobacter schindleri]|uniref:acyl-CoA dehydrogenase n=1 Tax=Acinetobacter schindleri TaxID=108981 RepID=UPI00209AA527|nr:acyl-CoA dehydrogenase [Acinetobacter schindleri]MCO8068133.1 acyl-CoA dehydrogenase [Acinetobacter schindleri]